MDRERLRRELEENGRIGVWVRAVAWRKLVGVEILEAEYLEMAGSRVDDW
jgi:hypothetical protein